jgi:hypothetical protein
VPSFSHELLVDLFRACGELAPALLDATRGIQVDHERAEQDSIDLSQVTSTEYRADAVVVLRGPDNAATGALVIEVQLGIDARKQRSWPVYVTTLHARHGCPVTLLVLAPDPRVARWASTPIDLGHPGFCLVPVVIGFEDVPRIVDPETALNLPELAVLSALAHPQLETALTAIAALDGLPEDRAKVYLDVVLAALSPDDRKTLEARMQGYVYQSEFARKYYSEGREQGLEQGREQGLEQGREQGLEQGVEVGLRTAVLALVRGKLGAVAPEDIERIAAVRSEQQFTRLIGVLARATTAIEIRDALAAAGDSD